MSKKKRSASGLIKSKAGLLKAYRGCPREVQKYFEHLPTLVAEYPLDVCLAYAFSRLELGQNMSLYCGVVKLHRANAATARTVVSTHYMTRKNFLALYNTVYGLALPSAARKDLKSAEETRDTVMHGKPASEERTRNAIGQVLSFATAVNRQLDNQFKIKPFGDLRGFSGASQKLDARTTMFMLKGMQFSTT